MNVARAAQILRSLYPAARIRVDSRASALIIVGSPADVDAMRSIVQGLDIQNPTTPTNDVIQVHAKPAAALAIQVRPLYPTAHIALVARQLLLVRATPRDMAQIKALISSLDVVSVTPTPTAVPVSSVHISVASPKYIARAVERAYPHVRADVSGSAIILVGPGEMLDAAQKLAQSLDAPGVGVRYTQIYRIRNVDAESVGALIQRSFPATKVNVDKAVNAISIFATADEHQRISAGIEQIDAGTSQNGQQQGGAAYSDANVDVVQLESAMPGLNGSPSTSANDIAMAVQQALSPIANDLHIAVPANTNEIILTGSPQSIRLAKGLIARLDATMPLVVLDTEVLEMDQSAARNLGISTPGGVISSVFTEMQPTPNPLTGQPGRVIGLQPLTRTGLQFTVAINTLISNGNARVLADPRITTISGRTATIHAGDQINILTQTGGSIGTPVTQQLQTFNTGVSLDITPMVGPAGSITVALHPVVNSLTGVSGQAGIPQISTRDTQTVVQLKDNQTLVIGGLIQEETQHSVTKVPLIGEIPLIGRLFNSSNTNYQRNELVIVVTPHIIKPGESAPPPTATLGLPTPAALPTIPPGTVFPLSASPLATPSKEPTPTPRRTPIPLDVGPLPTAPPAPRPTPMQTPVAFASANVFQFGTPPQNAYASPLDAPQIFYATLSPTVLKQGSQMTVSVITTTNVTKVTIGNIWSTTALSRLSPSTWQASFAFSANGQQGTTNLQLIASRSDGTSAQIPIPVSVLGSS